MPLSTRAFTFTRTCSWRVLRRSAASKFGGTCAHAFNQSLLPTRCKACPTCAPAWSSVT